MANPSDIPGALSNALIRGAYYEHRMLNGLALKIIGFILTLIDHIGLIFFSPTAQPLIYEALRATGRAAFPIFVFLALEGVYHTHDYLKYFLRLLLMAILLDAFCYGVYYGAGATNLTPGNVFTDLALGTLVIYLIRRNDPFTLLIPLPIAYLVLSDFTAYRLGASSPLAIIPFGIASDYGTYGLLMFLIFYGAYELGYRYLKYHAQRLNLDVLTYANLKLRSTLNIAVALALIVLGAFFQILYSTLGPGFPLEPGISWPLESWSMFAIIPLLFYDGRAGTTSRPVRYSLYLFYPAHLILLYLISLAV